MTTDKRNFWESIPEGVKVWGVIILVIVALCNFGWRKYEDIPGSKDKMYVDAYCWGLWTYRERLKMKEVEGEDYEYLHYFDKEMGEWRQINDQGWDDAPDQTYPY